MGKKASKSSGKVSGGGRQRNNVNHEAKRQELFKKRREEGTNYKYQPNPYKEGTEEYLHEQLIRHEKVLNSRRLPYAWKKHCFALMENWLAKQKESNKTKEKTWRPKTKSEE